MKRRIAIFTKNDLTALIGLNTSPEQNFVTRTDPRFQPNINYPNISIYDASQSAETAFAHSLRLSLERGWRIAYYGPPLHG